MEVWQVLRFVRDLRRRIWVSLSFPRRVFDQLRSQSSPVSVYARCSSCIAFVDPSRFGWVKGPDRGGIEEIVGNTGSRSVRCAWGISLSFWLFLEHTLVSVIYQQPAYHQVSIPHFYLPPSRRNAPTLFRFYTTPSKTTALYAQRERFSAIHCVYTIADSRFRTDWKESSRRWRV